MPKKRTNLKPKIKKKKVFTPKESEPQVKPEELIEEYLKKAEEEINAFNYESAIEHCQNALSVDSQSIKSLEMLASIFMEMQDMEKAENLYRQCVDLSPDIGYSKYLALGQMYDGRQSLQFYQKGISIIEKMIEDLENAKPEAYSAVPPLHRTLSDAFSSIAELYMTDLCDEEDAERNCEDALQQSIKADDSNPEAYQCLASLRLIQENDEEAKLQITKSISFWLPQHEEDTNPEAENCLPEFENRIKTSQILIELSMFEEATKILERLLDENDQAFVVWYLLGWANFIHGEIYKGNAKHYFIKAKEVAAKTKSADEDQLNHIDELLKELDEVESDNENDEEFKSSSENSDEEMET